MKTPRNLGRQKARLLKHFPGAPVQGSAYAESQDGRDYVVGAPRLHDGVEYRGQVADRAVEYSINVLRERAEVPALQLQVSKPFELQVVLTPTDDALEVRAVLAKDSLDLRSRAFSGFHRSGTECFQKCGRDIRCWLECMKFKGAQLGVQWRVGDVSKPRLAQRGAYGE